MVILFSPDGSDPVLVAAVQAGISGELDRAGLRFETRQELALSDLQDNLRLVIALPPAADLATLASAAPQTQFVALGITGVEPGNNRSVIGALGLRYDQQGFMAGMIAAVITPDWRVAVISRSDTPGGLAARQGFMNGAIHYCGLCLAYHGPIFDYPMYIELPGSAAGAEWKAAADYLIGQAVKTIYVSPGAGDAELLAYLGQSGINVIGEIAPLEELRSHWVASLQPDPVIALQTLLPDLLSGKGGFNIPMPIRITQVNEELFSPGKQMAANEILQELLSGYIDTGIDPLTGQSR